jgi:hypothetical protein
MVARQKFDEDFDYELTLHGKDDHDTPAAA